MKIMSSTQYKSDVTIVIGRVPETKKIQFSLRLSYCLGEERGQGGKGMEGGEKQEKSRRETQAILL